MGHAPPLTRQHFCLHVLKREVPPFIVCVSVGVNDNVFQNTPLCNFVDLSLGGGREGGGGRGGGL